MAFSLSKLLEPEEFVGELWHRLIANPTDLPRYPEAAVRFADVRGQLGPFFRALGGEAGVELKAHGLETSGTRLGFWHKLGHAAFQLPRARFDGDALLLPEALDVFPSPALNRDLYYWLAAWATALGDEWPQPHDDPLQADIAALRFAWRVSRRVLFFAPGLKPRYRRLCAAALKVRPERRLPEAEERVEAAIRALLKAADALPPEEERVANPILSAIIVDDRPPPRAPAQPPDIVPPRGDWAGARGGSAIPVEQSLADFFPFSAPRGYKPFLPVPLWGDAVARRPEEAAPRPEDAEAGSGQPPAEEDRDRTWRARRHRKDKAGRKDPLILYRFEALLALAEFLNLARLVDDETDEEEARKARDDLEEISLVDVRKKPSTKLAFDLDMAPEDIDREQLSAEHAYPEWDYRKQTLLPDHCRVLTSVADEAAEDAWQPDADMRRRIRMVKRQFEALRPRRELLRRQLDGTELDTDALVRSFADLKAHGEGSERIWMQHLQTARDLSVAVLFDTSRSTESWVQGRQVIDIARETLLALAAGLEACGDDHAIFAFSSVRREKVFVQTIKDFGERFGEKIQRRVAALRPGFYTRLGAAIRHASARLAERPAHRQLLLVITDGKPNDLDHYEGRYGVEDTRMAVREARALGQKVFGVTIDKRARAHFSHMFGRHGHAIVSRPARLAQALPRLYRHLVM